MIDVSWLLGSCELVPVKVGCSNNLGLGKYPEDLTHFTIILIRWHHLLKTWKQWKHRKTGFIMVESLNLYVILILYNMEKMETQENYGKLHFWNPQRSAQATALMWWTHFLALVRNSFCTAAIWVCAATDKIWLWEGYLWYASFFRDIKQWNAVKSF